MRSLPGRGCGLDGRSSKDERGMNEAQRHYGFCWVMYGAESAEHPPIECRQTAGLNVDMSDELRGSIRVDERCRDCWKCGVSEQNCKGVEKGQPCQWTGVAAVLWLSTKAVRRY
jgi:hypothetical protein